MIVAGIDPSLTSTGVGVLAHGKPAHHSHHGIRGHDSASYITRNRRIRWEIGQVRKTLSDFAIDLAVIEVLPPGNRGAFAGRDDRITLVNGLIGEFDSRGIPMVFLLPSSVKAWATGHGRADKADMIAAVNSWHPGLNLTNDDEADAMALAHIGAYSLDDPMPFEIQRRHPHIFDVGEWPVHAAP